jgi:2-oxoglutarate ferredoxin oxidoreductase subunit delta
MNKVTVNKVRCKRCGICISFCPVNLFDEEIDGTPIPSRVDKCTGCKLCELRCPDFAIKVEVDKVEE